MAFKLDMQAVARVAGRVQLGGVRLVDMNLKRLADARSGRRLSANVDRACTISKQDAESLEVTCRYEFRAKDDHDQQLAVIDLTYALQYLIDSEDPINAEDAEQFAFANGAYNSWPFARELLHSMSVRMGFPAFVLPVLTFSPPRPKVPIAPEGTGRSPAKSAKQ